MAGLGPRVNDYDARCIEIGSVECHNRQIVRQRGRGGEAVLDWHRAPVRAKHREQFHPAQSRRNLPRDALQPLYSRSNPVDRVSALRAALAKTRSQADPTPKGARRTTLR